MSDDLRPILRELDEIARQLAAIREELSLIRKGPASAAGTEGVPCQKCGTPTQLVVNGAPICVTCDQKRDSTAAKKL